MKSTGTRRPRNDASRIRETKLERDPLSDELDALFRLPLAEFTGARNALAARLKKSGRAEDKTEAARVKALAKPPISAWAVNQLYWNHREAFDQLIASGERFHKAQISRSAAKAADMRAALEARREALTELSDLATSLLQDAGHNPSLDTIRRITTTLEGISAYAQRSDGPQPGRLTHDVDPPGFESFGSFTPRTAAPTLRPVLVTASKKSSSPAAKSRNDDKRQVEATRKAKIAEAKVSLQDAKKSLTEARANAQKLEAAQKKADAEAKKAEQHKHDAEEEWRKARVASEDAARRARSAAVEAKQAGSAVSDAERTVEEATKELELLFGE